MKIMTLGAHTNVQQELFDLSRVADQISGFAFTRVRGHGNEIEITDQGFCWKTSVEKGGRL